MVNKFIPQSFSEFLKVVKENQKLLKLGIKERNGGVNNNEYNYEKSISPLCHIKVLLMKLGRFEV